MHNIIKNKSDSLSAVLKQLLQNSITDSLAKEITKNLVDLYSDENYRHSYSVITAIILDYSKSEESDIEWFEILSQNLRIIKKYIEEYKTPKIILKFNKLFDHINLELIRIEYIGEVKKIQLEVEKINKKAKQARREIRQSTQEATKSFITILGIFASIIIAFVSGISFSSSILSNIDKTNILKLLIVISFIAMFITNILNFLFYFIKTIHFGKEFKEPMLNCGIIIFNLIIFCLIIALIIIQGIFISIR